MQSVPVPILVLTGTGPNRCRIKRHVQFQFANKLPLLSEAKARVLGPGDLHVKAGSSVTLICVINQGPHDLGTVFWYLGANILQTPPTHPNDPDSTERLSIQNHWSDGLTSRLHISSARLSDSGNYSCVPTIAAPASVNVHVINGEHPAAMQHGNKNTAPLSPSLHCTLVYSISVFIIKHIR
ncbi:uncharacterized protein LOC116181635 [Photinus pyralis]|uniref:uncharacterized protein LOC116181635 n=1 Tax=Photinus pyralis TaxID=7054 RepID=UPI00126742BD|nr:uncharacterized protein LOC116181635 [Photinus pyralis]